MRLATVAIPLALSAPVAHAFIPIPVGGHAGEVDLSFRATLERGLVEPHAAVESFQDARWEVYQLGAGYTLGDIGVLQDVRLSVDGAFFVAPAEQNDVARGTVSPAMCAGVSLGATQCQFHPADSGFFITPRVAVNVVHSATLSFGFYVQATIPIGVDLERFVLPRLDYVAGGMTFGAHLTSWLGFESSTFVGSGAFSSTKQNGAVAQTLLLSFEAERWVLPWRAGVKVGTFFEGDLRDRFDPAYDAAYAPDRRERIRAVKFGVALLPYFQVTPQAAVELGYVQKLFGYDAVATKTFYAGVRAAF